jgi:hypothetical protein
MSVKPSSTGARVLSPLPARALQGFDERTILLTLGVSLDSSYGDRFFLIVFGSLALSIPFNGGIWLRVLNFVFPRHDVRNSGK